MTHDKDEYYVDDFGNLKKRRNLKNWQDYAPWQFWQPRYNWIKCDDEFEAFDRICWRDDVYETTSFGQSLHEGARFVIGEIRKLKNSKQGMVAAIVVIHAEDLDPYPHNAEIYRSLHRILKNGAYRAPRHEEGRWLKHQPDKTLFDLQRPEPSKPKHNNIDNRGQGASDTSLPKPISRFFNGFAKPSRKSEIQHKTKNPNTPKL